MQTICKWQCEEMKRVAMMSVKRTGREERMGATARGAVRSCKGSSYIEYIVVATAMAAAAMAL